MKVTRIWAEEKSAGLQTFLAISKFARVLKIVCTEKSLKTRLNKKN